MNRKKTKKRIDTNKSLRDEIDSQLEEKLMQNLKWSMLFFCFNHLCRSINIENDFEDNDMVQFQFINNWVEFVSQTICKEDLKTINDVY